MRIDDDGWDLMQNEVSSSFIDNFSMILCLPMCILGHAEE